MVVVSQNKKFQVTYENNLWGCDNQCIYIFSLNSDKYRVFAKYSSEKEVMDKFSDLTHNATSGVDEFRFD